MSAREEEPPPFGRTWKRIYFAILIYLCGLIAVFWWFTESWNR